MVADTAKHHNKRTTKRKKSMKMKDQEEEKSYRLLRYDELPEYMKENEFILGYYRVEWPLPRAVLSLFSWHNETLNVWTHLVGFLLFLALAMMHLGDVRSVADLLENLPWSIPPIATENTSCNQEKFFNDEATLIKINSIAQTTTATNTRQRAARWPFFVFLSGSMLCLLTSSLCHLLSCHSRHLNLFLARLDYAGISIMIVASFFPPLHYIFLCDPLPRLVYLAAITILGLAALYFLLSPRLAAPYYRPHRTFLFLAMGFSGLVPAVHATVANWANPRRNVTLAYEGSMAALFLAGTSFFLSRVPEKWWPGKFDLVGCSHQIFHVFVVAGAAAHYGAALLFLDWRDRVGCAVV